MNPLDVLPRSRYSLIILDTLAPIELVLLMNSRCVCGARLTPIHASRCRYLRTFVEWVKRVRDRLTRSAVVMRSEGRCRICLSTAPPTIDECLRHLLSSHPELALLTEPPPPWCSASWREGDAVVVTSMARRTTLGKAIERVAQLRRVCVYRTVPLNRVVRDIVMHRDEVPSLGRKRRVSGVRGGRRIVLVP